MVHWKRCLRSIVVAFFIISASDLLHNSDAHFDATRISRSGLYKYLLSGNRIPSPDLKNSFYSYVPAKNFVSRPVRRLGSEFLGKRSLIENDQNDFFDGNPLQVIDTDNDIPEGGRSNITDAKDKRKINIYGNRSIKSLFSFLLKNKDDYYGKRFGSFSNSRALSPFGIGRDKVGSEFLGKRAVNCETLGKSVVGSEFLGKRALGSEFLGKRGLESECLGKRALGSEFLGKRALGSEFLGKRALGSEFLGKRALGSEFLGKRALGSEFLGKRVLGSEFLGKRALGSEFLGKRALGSEFLGKRALGSEFLGKRALGSEFLGKRALGSEFLGKRTIGNEFFVVKPFVSDILGKTTIGRDILDKNISEDVISQFKENSININNISKDMQNNNNINTKQLLDTEGENLTNEALDRSLWSKRALGREFLGKKSIEMDVLDKRRLGSEFLGKRLLDESYENDIDNDFLEKRKIGSEFLGKRALGREFLGKRPSEFNYFNKQAIENELINNRDFNIKYKPKPSNLMINSGKSVNIINPTATPNDGEIKTPSENNWHSIYSKFKPLVISQLQTLQGNDRDYSLNPRFLKENSFNVISNDYNNLNNESENTE